MLLEKIKENRKYLLSLLPFITPVFISGMLIQSYLDRPTDHSVTSLNPFSVAPPKYKMGDCVLEIRKTEFEENSYPQIINQVGRESYSVSTLFYSEIHKQYVAFQAISEKRIEEVDMTAGNKYIQSASWKKINCPEFVNDEGRF